MCSVCICTNVHPASPENLLRRHNHFSPTVINRQQHQTAEPEPWPAQTRNSKRAVWSGFGCMGGGWGCPSQPQTTIKQIGQPPLEATIQLDVNSSGFQSDRVRSLKLQQHQPTFLFPNPLLWRDAFPMATHNNQSTMCTCNTRQRDVTSCQEGCE